MKSILLFILTMLSATNIVGQIGLIKDKDGWTNVRAEPNGSAEVIHRIKVGELFWYDFEVNIEKVEWIEVYVPKDNFTLNGYEGKSYVGFIHSSRLIELSELEQYEGDNFKFEYFISEFDSTGRVFTYQDNKWPIAIDNRFMWGTDGYFPYSQLDSIIITLDNQLIDVDKSLYDDLFNVRTDMEIYRIEDLYVVYHWNSDGAGGYEIAWVIDKYGIRQRLLGASI